MSADTSGSRSPKRGRLARLFDDGNYLRFVDRAEQQLAKLLGLALLLVMAAATVQLLATVVWSVSNPGTPWLARNSAVPTSTRWPSTSPRMPHPGTWVLDATAASHAMPCAVQWRGAVAREKRP